jgi:hypothetical protein
MRQQLNKKTLRGDKRVTLTVHKFAAGKPALLEWLNKRDEKPVAATVTITADEPTV